jgi:hypothetical protein
MKLSQIISQIEEYLCSDITDKELKLSIKLTFALHGYTINDNYSDFLVGLIRECSKK